MSLQFDIRYFFGFLVVLLIEVLIAVYIKTGFIRHTFGDVLVVVLMYCFIKSVLQSKTLPAALFVLTVAFVIEYAQKLNVLKALHLETNSIAKLVLGNTFEPWDLVAYFVGFLTIIIIENLKHIS